MPDPLPTRARDVLRRDEAAARAKRVSAVSYQLEVELAEGASSYLGRAEVRFSLDEPDLPLFIEFTGRVRALRVNGTLVTPDHRGHRLYLPPERLRPSNAISVDFHNDFDATGDGFHRFVDPEDGLEYLYSNFEPFAAHRLFPCFDQPDIKADYQLNVIAPAHWRIVSAELAAPPTRLADGRLRHVFDGTPRFSTYLFSLIAGPFERISSSHAGIPLGLYGRRSMRRELERAADELFEVTGQGLDYFRELFGRDFPFTKYDQLFVPEFNAGAMENVGAVTFHDSFIFRDPPTYGQRLGRGEVVLHELAHMWFGNLVTMRWWDDLWLNETFATYLSYRCLAEATQFSDAWQVFNGQMRPSAYRQDQLITTHAIATGVEDTDQAVSNFDAITYEKGAAVIKQLVAALGEEAFRSGVQAYFERHAWSNATLDDFLGALGDAAGRSLGAWSRAWLESPSLNTIGVRWTSAAGRIESMELWQTAPDHHPTLRPHATEVGLVTDLGPDGRLRVASLPVSIATAAAAVPAAIGLPVPRLVYPNFGDHDFALSSLDAVSLDFALTRLPDIPDALLRQQLWSAFWEMVRDARLRSLDFLDVVKRFAPGEEDRALVQAIVDRASATLLRYVPAARIADESAALVDVAVAAMQATPHQDLRLVWARAATAFASDAFEVDRLIGLIDGRWSVRGFEPDQQMRWTLAVKAVAHDLDGAAEALLAEAARDGSDRGQRALLRAEASRPDAAAKAAAWARINGDGFGSDYLTRSAISGFQWLHQRDVLLEFRAPFFERIEKVYASRDHAFAESYVRWLMPDLWAEQEVLRQIRESIDASRIESMLLRRQLEEISDDLARTIRVREFAGAVEVSQV